MIFIYKTLEFVLVFTFFCLFLCEYCIWMEVKKVVDQFFKQMTLNLIKKVNLIIQYVIYMIHET